MSGIYQVAMGDGGLLVIPAELRARAGLIEVTRLVLVETAGGLLLLNTEQLKARVRADLGGLDLIGEILAERRVAATADDGR